SLAQRNASEALQAQKIVELISSAVDQARSLAKGLHPVSIHSTKGLIAALEELAARVRESIPCQLLCPSRVHIPPTIATHLYRIAQEAIRNALKHAQATKLVIALEIQNEQLLLSVSDNGRGFLQETEGSGGMGLLNLQYRARAIGGKLTLESLPGKGVLIQCSVPCEHALGAG
ncbi:MAG: ATP-binding protein, partial [Verrucomicrobiota bacterium]